MLSPETVSALAAQLEAAQLSRRQMPQVSRAYPQMDIDDAYAVQQAWVRHKIATGRVARGHKIGLTSRAMQRSSSIEEPDYGVLLDDMFFDDGAELPADRFIVPRVEVELAFILDRALSGPRCTVVDVLDATRYVMPALEIIDARIEQVDGETGRTRTVLDTISDNAANAAVVLGGNPFRPNDIDLRWVSALCYRNAVIEESGVAAAVLNHPAMGVAWLANRLGPRGVTLQPGDVILSGSFTSPVPARPGDTFHVDYGPLGSVSCHFGDDESASHDG
ncbi:2-oxo-hepta-3-ene-1,7-dioic acid hydratase [Mycolicibacterium mucogenicum]|uniref:2-oxo-hepta-3-ene-1,7-dioic acid hydratase n=1 Tax=Mycolicibacterium mucogenicum TaxID=56689 RepID=A0A1A3GHR9_MYCMU|nr:2-oxo-hepta-3-ene-1,7-dioic acid hydratase [Mycolicibacterium mucogenicum]OBJ35355.1 2-oxo-hepta-3-ene-1,7-dioic acid hydratase [Mycolicibacterium mucogenicum]